MKIWGMDWQNALGIAGSLVTIIWAAIALAAAAGGLLLRRHLRRRRTAVALQPAPDHAPPSAAGVPPLQLAGLVARPMMTVPRFKDRVSDLASLGRLVSEGKGVIWVTGPARQGRAHWYLGT